MQELLLGSWGPQIVAYSQQYPWRVFAAVLVATLLVPDLMFRKKRSSSGGDGGDISGFDFGDGDGGGCGD
jgi:uncharacterized membrane protein YgcG